MSRNIDDISSRFWVLVHPDTISINDSQLRKNWPILTIYRSNNDISMILSIGFNAWNDVRVLAKVCALSTIYRQILLIYQEKIGDISVTHGRSMLFDLTAKIRLVFFEKSPTATCRIRRPELSLC